MTTKAELLEQAADLDIEGRSSMSKGELEKAVAKAGGKVDGDISSTSGARDHAQHELDQAARGRSTGLAYREGR